MLQRYETIPSTLPSQPRVAAILSCQNNIMALSWHMPISREPFRYAIAVREENHTHSLLVEYGSFTLNFLPFSFYDEIDKAGRTHGDEIDKFSVSTLTCDVVDPNGNRIIDQADYVYECSIIDTYQNGDHTIFAADVRAIHINENMNAHLALFLGHGEYATASAHSRVRQSSHVSTSKRSF